MLDLLPSGAQLWDKPRIFRSAPGAGKTSLLRLFTPSVLLNLHTFRRSDDLKELYQRMAEIGVVDEAGPSLLGVFHSCARNYATLEDLEFETARKERLLFGLLNARVILATLRSCLALHRLDFPNGLRRLSIEPTSFKNWEQNFELVRQEKTFGIGRRAWRDQSATLSTVSGAPMLIVCLEVIRFLHWRY